MPFAAACRSANAPAAMVLAPPVGTCSTYIPGSPEAATHACSYTLSRIASTGEGSRTANNFARRDSSRSANAAISTGSRRRTAAPSKCAAVSRKSASTTQLNSIRTNRSNPRRPCPEGAPSHPGSAGLGSGWISGTTASTARIASTTRCASSPPAIARTSSSLSRSISGMPPWCPKTTAPKGNFVYFSARNVPACLCPTPTRPPPSRSTARRRSCHTRPLTDIVNQSQVPSQLPTTKHLTEPSRQRSRSPQTLLQQVPHTS